jgi:hypothetical protein
MAERRADYIGAKWPYYSDGITIGNSGFCLRSRKIAEGLGRATIAFDDTSAVDLIICRTRIALLSKVNTESGLGRKALRSNFRSRMNRRAGRRSAFTAGSNVAVCRGLAKLFEGFDPRVPKTERCFFLFCNYYRLRRFETMCRLYTKMNRIRT